LGFDGVRELIARAIRCSVSSRSDFALAFDLFLLIPGFFHAHIGRTKPPTGRRLPIVPT
jgi:hypothetical protein